MNRGLPCSQEPSTVLPAGPRRSTGKTLAGPLGSSPVPTPVPWGPLLGQGLASPGPMPCTTDGTPWGSKAQGGESRGHAGRFPGWGWASSGAIQTIAGEKGALREVPLPHTSKTLPPLPLLLGHSVAVFSDRLRHDQGCFRQAMGGVATWATRFP